MTRDEYMQALQRDGAALADAVSGHLDQAVPACPGWNVADLVWHIGEVHLFWRTIAELQLDDWRPAEDLKPERPADDALVAWYREGVDATVRVLTEADPATPVWTWTPQKNIAFIQRRMAQETAVHRWDAEDAAGNRFDIDPVLAVDGIDEFLDYFTADVVDGHETDHESVHLHCTDTDGEWLVRVDGPELSFTRGHEKGDAAARGSASDLLLLLWRRKSPDAVDVVGDPDALARFLARTNLD